MIHELGHVWQGENEGPFYISHALYSQGTMGQAAYEYTQGHPSNEASLEATTNAGGGLETYNPEQQAQIIADYYTQLVDKKPTTAWDPYIAEVRAAA
jgi:broad specificity polyphosphatase/5'/3'-nucleotidase SurE